MRQIIPPLLSFVCVCACAEPLRPIELAAQGPFALEDALAYFDRQTASLVVVDPAGGAGKDGDRRLARLEAGLTPVVARSVRRAGADAPQLLVLDPGDEQVLLIRDKRGSREALDIGVPLEAVDVSADGRFAVAYQPDGATPSRSLFAFPNTVAVLDLREETLSAVPLRLGTPGARPLRAVFAGATRLSATFDDEGTPRQITAEVPLALVFVKGGIIPVDLEKAVAGPMVPLGADLERSIVPAEVIFTNNAVDQRRGTLDNVERAFVRSTVGELYVLSIALGSAALTGDPRLMDVVVALENVVTPDAYVHDIELFFDADGNELLLAAAGYELVLVDGYTGVADRFPQTVMVDTLARFTDPTSGQAMALGYGRAAPDYAVLRLDPLGLDRRRSTGVELLRLGSPVVSIDVTANAERAVVEYSDGRDLGVLDLRRAGDVLDLRFARRLQTRRLSPAGERLWLVSVSPEDEAPHLAEVELDELLGTREVRLDQDGALVGQAGRFLFVDHGDPTGSVTFFPDDDLRRAKGLAFRGVLYTDLLDQPLPTEHPLEQGEK